MDTTTNNLQLYLGVRLAEVPYFRMPLKVLQDNTTVIDLKSEIEVVLNQSSKAFELIYCGRVLSDDQTLAQQRVRHGATIHVFQRPAAPPAAVARTEVQEADIMAAVAALRKVTAQLSLVRSFSPGVIRDVLEEYPEFFTELGAQAILRHLLLWSKIGKIDTARRIAETYPILIRSAPFVVNSFRKHGGALGRDADSSVSLADALAPTDDEVAVAPAPAAASTSAQLLISRHQLANALLQARSDALARMDSSDDQQAVTAAAGPSTSAATTSESGMPSARRDDVSAEEHSAAGSTNRISSQALQNAMRSAYVSAAYGSVPVSTAEETAAGAVPPLAASASEPVDAGAGEEAAAAAAAVPAALAVDDTIPENLQLRFPAELMIMREMGLTNDLQNVAALIVCNGNVERAIDMVLSGLN